MNLGDKISKMMNKLTRDELITFQDAQILNSMSILARELDNEKLSITLQDKIETAINGLMKMKVKNNE